ncbi:MAG: hypothetical protein CSB55_05595 [Candidatus Cloacimonadota bacterium]|nr:MAG: hypothetical protein CSB55_05595 [Candidatus Cloacimonadota bacterium]
MQNKNILVLGAGCELGLSFIGSADYNFWAGYRSKESLMRLENIKNPKLIPIKTDFSAPESFTEILASVKQIDAVADFAQGNYESLVAAADYDKISDFYKTNVINRIALIKLIAGKMLRQKHGKMIYISSSAASKINPGQGFYSSAKLACEQIYKAVGIELARKGISCTVIRPGYLNLGRGKDYLAENPEALNKIPDKNPVSAESIVNTINMIINENSASFNGSVITIDGGMNIAK